MDYDNTNRGAIFRNEKKSTEKHPDMNGSINIEGKEYWISGWSNVSKAGAKYLSLSVSAKDEQPTQSKPAPSNAVEFDDDLPF